MLSLAMCVHRTEETGGLYSFPVTFHLHLSYRSTNTIKSSSSTDHCQKCLPPHYSVPQDVIRNPPKVVDVTTKKVFTNAIIDHASVESSFLPTICTLLSK